MWVLVFRWGLWVLKCYVDNTFSISRVGDVGWYTPYAKEMLTGQV